MEFACLRCREHVRVALGTNGEELAEISASASPQSFNKPANEGQDGVPATATASESNAIENPHGGKDVGRASGPVAVRCRRCDGLYHASCIVTCGRMLSGFECAACSHRNMIKDDDGENADTEPLLLPPAVLALMTENGHEATVEEDEAEEWAVITQDVEVCTACRQVNIAREEVVTCSQCHATTQRHRCCAGDESLSSPGRKRTRSQAMTPTGRQESAAACSSCDAAGGCVERRRVAVLVPRGEAVWWETCVSCQGNFCLHPLVGDQDDEEEALRDRLGQESEAGFLCRACIFRETVSLPIPVDTTLDSALPLEDEGTILLCDGCEGEFDIAKLDPPLYDVPEGDWFCPACQMQRVGVLDGDAHMVTLLICDGCENEFDMAAIIPPLESVPEGDWFCSECLDANKVHPDAEVDRVDAPVHGKQPVVEATSADNVVGVEEKVSSEMHQSDHLPIASDIASVPSSEPFVDIENAVEQSTPDGEAVPLIECDGCDDKFDVRTIRPAAPDVPKGDWFCDECEATRKRRKKGYAALKQEKARRVKARAEGIFIPINRGLSVARLLSPRVKLEPRRSSVPGLPGSSTVTLLICDGCDGEYDMTTLNPPLASIPRGDWYCPGCVDRGRSSASFQRPTPSTTACTVCKGPARWNRDAQRAARKRGDMTVLCNPCIQARMGSRPPPPPVIGIPREEKKRKRPGDVIQHDGRLQVNPVERIFAPVPVTVSYSASSTSNGSTSVSASNSATCGHVICTDDEGDGISDDDDDLIIIVCEICLSEFNMIDVLGDSQSLAPPPRPWYCLPCLRRLKKNRKKKQRISKQMMLEMQLYGGLLRPTAAKAVDPMVRVLRGKKPSADDEILALGELVGKRVGVLLSWDKHWVMGRVLSFEVASCNHLIHFDDESEQVLPLFAFPFVIGTSRIIEIKVPASQNRWWPAQVLKMNAIAERHLMQTIEDPNVLGSMRLVRLFSSTAHTAKTESVACWAPRHLCRALAEGTNLGVSDAQDDYKAAVREALNEDQIERSVRMVAFKALLRSAQDGGDDVWSSFARALVGCELLVNGNRTVTIKDFDAAAGLHRLCSGEDDEVQIKLIQVINDMAVDAHTLAKLELALNKAIRGVDISPSEENERESGPQDPELKYVPSRTSSIRPPPADSDGHCNKCGLPPVMDGDTSDAAIDDGLVKCIKCDNTFHGFCCDPPHGAFPLVSSEDGAILVEDIKSPFVCRECVTCQGCQTATSSRWYRWRLPLLVVSLCDNCIAVYDNKCQCAVCNKRLEDSLVNESTNLLKCTSCDLWVHPQCEPDPHPAFRRRLQQDPKEFELDLDIPLPDLAVKQQDQDDDDEEEATHTISKAANGFAAKPARLLDEECAFSLKFKDSYDARVFNNYECLSCRKVRLLRVLQRLRMEDKLDLFKEPVTKLIAPTYFDVIKQPMDLATMQLKVLDNAYTRVNFRDFRDDFELLCLNAVTFNSRDRDFLIWREAWRFYGQGQRILRLVAPKTRMKQRGGKYYDALVLAAKRQLPNNSQLGKTKQTTGGSDDEDEGDDDDGDDDEDGDELLDNDGDNDGLEDPGSGRESMSRAPDFENGAVPGDEELRRESLSLKSDTTGSASVDASVLAKSVVERRRAVDGIVRLSFTPQTELGLTPKPHSSLSFYLTMHSRSGAHAYCWVDACILCGTRGSHNDDMIFCIDCGEGFHTFCCGVDEKKFALEDHPIHTYWRCANCEMCEVCGKPHDKEESEGEESEWMECSHCDRSFHGKCLLPVIGSKHDIMQTEDDDSDDTPPQPESFYCSSCVTCKSCDKVPPRASYSYDRELCLTCCQARKSEQSLMSAKTKHLIQVWTSDARRQRKEAEKCPMCKNKWTAEDDDLIQCDACECWAHPLCDSAFVEDPSKYQELVNDSSAQYVCSVCRSHERTHLQSTPNLAKCQLLLDRIQNARILCDARWVEAREHMRQAQVWNEWKDNLAIYLYVLRIGEECLKNLAYRSVNFQDDWVRYSVKNKAQEIPAWLVQKAARYLRYKRYARGPRAAQRKLARKTENFYSQQGLDKQKEPHAIATVAAQASSCAALIVCVHLLYGWAPLQRVVFHLLESEDARLSEALVKSLLVDNSDTLEDEITKIKNQYERRARKKHLLRLQTDGEGDDIFEEEISPTGSSIPSVELESKPAGEGEPTNADDDNDPSKSETEIDKKTSLRETDLRAEEITDEAPKSGPSDLAPVPAPLQLPMTPRQLSSRPNISVNLTRAPPLSGQPKTSLVAGNTGSEDNRFCGLCFIVGDSSVCGRLVYVELDQWVHINCALWSSEVFEDAGGVLQRCQKALSRSKTNRCDGCGVLGATLGCTVSRCPRHYHFPCAIDRGVIFLPNGETCCPLPSHVQQGTKNFQLPELVRMDSLSSSVHSILPRIRPEQDAALLDDSASVEEPKVAALIDSPNTANGETESMEIDDTSAAASASALPLPLVSPLIKEPRHKVQMDFSTVFSDSKKRMNALHLKRQICFRIGALTVHSLGHIVIGNSSFYSRDAVFPLGFRSTRVYWSSRQLSTRCVYECVVSSTDVEARKEAKGKDAEDKPYSSPKALFKITASDDVENPIVAASPLEALLELRSRVVALYEDARCFTSSDENPFLSRRSWFSYGLLGHHFFGFGIPEIAREIESLPHVATTAIRRSFVVQRHRQQNQRKRRRGQDKLIDDEEAKVGDHVYVFSHRLPSPAEMAIAMREVEQVVEAEEHARLSSGAVRTDGLDRQVDEEEEAARRATRTRLNKDATRESSVQTPLEKAASGVSGSNDAAASTDATGAVVKEKQGVPMDLEHLPIAMQYRELRRRPFSERLEVLKSKIHGYGLFTKEKFVEGQMIVEYQGQMISQAVADVREKQYEEMGIGSCYMFRLDEKTIIDATRCGNLARFMNHSCDPKAYARVVVVENNEKKIVIFAKRTIEAFEEVTYDYKFPIEDEAIRCDCGAPNCIGRMN